MKFHDVYIFVNGILNDEVQPILFLDTIESVILQNFYKKLYRY